MLKYLPLVRVVFRRIRGPIYANCTRPISSQRPHKTEQSPVDIRVCELMMLSLSSYTCICPIQLETRLVRPGNALLVINSPMVVLPGSGEA
ncbi:hypothetical protein AVEN_94290-1 [Araneus ventricosus]|uniref:Uncharacterized protein n=1 Tax=Araneus ventricosus TaxID=182803 RepID=A0A4Y2IJT3_ARAVE|nr:hypothetical protein AVEN_94290-1 [Araneus ventricosus]